MWVSEGGHIMWVYWDCKVGNGLLLTAEHLQNTLKKPLKNVLKLGGTFR